MEDEDVLDVARNGIRILIISLESFSKVSSSSNFRNLNKTPPIPTQGRDLEDEDVLDGAGDGVKILIISLAFLKVLSRSNIRNLIKTPHIFQVSSWSLG